MEVLRIPPLHGTQRKDTKGEDTNAEEDRRMGGNRREGQGPRVMRSGHGINLSVAACHSAGARGAHKVSQMSSRPPFRALMAYDSSLDYPQLFTPPCAASICAKISQLPLAIDDVRHPPETPRQLSLHCHKHGAEAPPVTGSYPWATVSPPQPSRSGRTHRLCPGLGPISAMPALDPT